MNKENIKPAGTETICIANAKPNKNSNINKSNGQQQQINIVKFYKGKNVLLTGVTGFLGKVLLWKLLSSCKDIGNIYVLLRPKHDQTVETRLTNLLNNIPFKNIHIDNLSSKVIAINSDITKPVCGLTEENKRLLVEKVQIAIHSAASVRFDAPLNENMRDNVYGTKNLLELCVEFTRLEAFVHVSTAYSNCHLSRIDETLIPFDKPVDELIKDIESLSPEEAAKPPQEVMSGRPNTYTLTKAIAELLVSKYESKFSVSIVRPSIVISSADEPYPGWVDNFNGISGLGSLAAVGLLRTIDWDYYATSDMVPADYVASCIICAAYATKTQSPDKLKVYNMTSGNMKPISWGRFFVLLRNEALKNPPLKIVRPLIDPPKYRRVSKIEFQLTKFFSELLFAYFVDAILTLIGYKRLMVKITKKLHHGYKIMQPFTTGEWIFCSNNVIKLSESLDKEERETFNFDMRELDWISQANLTYRGTKQFLFKEDLSDKTQLSTARTRMKIVGVAHIILTVFLGFSLVLVGYSILKYITYLF